MLQYNTTHPLNFSYYRTFRNKRMTWNETQTSQLYQNLSLKTVITDNKVCECGFISTAQ